MNPMPGRENENMLSTYLSSSSESQALQWKVEWVRTRIHMYVHVCMYETDTLLSGI